MCDLSIHMRHMRVLILSLLHELVHTLTAGDFKLYSKLDPDGTGTCNKEGWMTYMRDNLEKKEGKGRGKGATWLRMLMDTLKKGCKSDAQVKQEAAARRSVVAQQMNKVKDVWYALMKKKGDSDGGGVKTLRKEEFDEAAALISLEVADPDLFAKIDEDGDGVVSAVEWTSYFQASHATKEETKEESGDLWIEMIMRDLHKGCLDTAQLKKEEAKRKEEVEELMMQCEGTYRLLSSQNSAEPDLLKKPELVKAHGGTVTAFVPIPSHFWQTDDQPFCCDDRGLQIVFQTGRRGDRGSHPRDVDGLFDDRTRSERDQRDGQGRQLVEKALVHAQERLQEWSPSQGRRSREKGLSE